MIAKSSFCLAGMLCFALTIFAKPVPKKTPHTIIPLAIEYDKKHHDITPIMQVTVNGVTVNVVFDTGSSGLRLIKGALNNVSIKTTSQRVRYKYGSNRDSLRLSGPVAEANLTIGGLNNKSVRIMLVDSLKYGMGDWGPTLDSPTVHSMHFRNIQGIMGVGLRAAKNLYDVVNPIALMPGNGSYIVRFPRLGGDRGQVIVNPTDTDLAGFTYFHLAKGPVDLPNGYSSWFDDRLNGTLTINGQSVNAPSMLDCGTTSTTVYANIFSGRTLIPAGSKAYIQVADNVAPETSVGYGFTVDAQEIGKDRMYTNSGPRTKIIMGTQMFFTFDVYYDPENGIIGLRRKD